MPGKADRRLDQRRPDSPPPQLRFDEQPVELGRAMISAYDRKTGKPVAKLGDDDLTTVDVLGGQGNRVGMGEQSLAIFVERQRRASLQFFELSKLLDPGGAEANARHD